MPKSQLSFLAEVPDLQRKDGISVVFKSVFIEPSEDVAAVSLGVLFSAGVTQVVLRPISIDLPDVNGELQE